MRGYLPLLLFGLFACGYLIGAVSAWELIKRYKKMAGLNSDPLDGKEMTSMERFVSHNQKALRQI